MNEEAARPSLLVAALTRERDQARAQLAELRDAFELTPTECVVNLVDGELRENPPPTKESPR